MKTFLYFIFVLGSLFIILDSCTKEQSIEEASITGKLIDNSECKSFEGMFRGPNTPDTLSCIDYSYDANNKLLTLKHINAGFNCCPGKLTASVSYRNDTITIKESEEFPGCNCNCLFDLTIELEGVESKSYYLKIFEPYCSEQEKLYFDIDLQHTNEGIFCVNRKKYPWGSH